jgi:hypothetical protein
MVGELTLCPAPEAAAATRSDMCCRLLTSTLALSGSILTISSVLIVYIFVYEEY